MDFENRIISKEIQNYLYETGKTIGTAESCTGGRIAEAIISTPGASAYFKGGIISYTNEVKENLLGVSHEVLEAKTAVCEEVASAMVKGACSALNVDYAIAATGIAGPGGGTPTCPVGTIWVACGTKDEVETMMLSGDNGRDANLTNATYESLKLFLNHFIKRNPKTEREQNA